MGVEVPEPRSEAVERELSVLIGGVAVGGPATAFVPGERRAGPYREGAFLPSSPAGSEIAVFEPGMEAIALRRRPIRRSGAGAPRQGVVPTDAAPGENDRGDFIECEAPEREAFHGSGAPCRGDAPGRNGTARGNGQKPRLP